VYPGQVVNLEGDATDAQDGVIPDADLDWSSQAGSLGSGARVSTETLPVGANLITLSVTNSVGVTAARTVTITVDGNVGAPGPTLTAGPGQLGWQVAAGEVQLQSATLYVGNSGSGSLQFTASSNAPWLMLDAPGGTAPATLTLSANPAGFADGTVQDTIVTLGAVGFPDQVIGVPVRLAVGNTFEAASGSQLVPVNRIYGDGFE